MLSIAQKLYFQQIEQIRHTRTKFYLESRSKFLQPIF